MSAQSHQSSDVIVLQNLPVQDKKLRANLFLYIQILTPSSMETHVILDKLLNFFL